MHKLVSAASRFRKSGLAGPLLTVAAGTTAIMTANAQITYSGLQDLSVNMVTTGTTNTQLISLTGSAVDDFTLEGYTFFTKQDFGRVAGYASGFEVESSTSGKNGANPTFLTVGATVGSSSSFTTISAAIAVGNSTTYLTAGDDKFVGFTFNPSSILPLYGWAQFTRSADSNTLTLVDWAYDTSGSAIQVGAGGPASTPEPSTLALGMTGVVLGGIRWYQRRRARTP